jgi:TM2 domain-containing membrane protein YozV
MSSIPPPVRGGVKGRSETFLAGQPAKSSAMEMVLGRSSNPEPSSFAPLQSDFSNEAKEPFIRSSGRSSKKRKNELQDESVIIPDTARFWSYVWWGAGKLYGGCIQGALFWSFVELMLLMMIILPLLHVFMPELGSWQNPQLDLRVLESKVMSIGNSQIRNGFRAVLSPLASSSFNRFLMEHSRKHLHIFIFIVGLSLFIWYEFKLPEVLFKQILFENMSGNIIEVRQDLTIKIDIGEDKGVKAGYIFAVKKKKHINQVSGGDFKTMVMAPTWFVAGKAKVMSTASSFSICKFKRLSGEASSPSIGDAVVVMKSEL